MSKDEADLKKVTPSNLAVALAVVAAVQVLAIGITVQNSELYAQIVNSTGYSYNPLGSSAAGSTANALVLVVGAFALTLVLVRLLRRKMVLSFKVIVFASLALSAFILTLFTADDFAFQYIPALEVSIAIGVPAILVAAIAYTVFVKNRVWLSTAVIGFTGAEVGSFFAQTLPPYTAIILPVVFSIYDIYAVFKGPLKQLVGTGAGIALVGMSIRAGEFTLGLGDIVFYTMLPSLAYFQFGTLAAVEVILAIDAGVMLTLYLLSRRRLLPGLPIPMLFGLTALLASIL